MPLPRRLSGHPVGSPIIVHYPSQVYSVLMSDNPDPDIREEGVQAGPRPRPQDAVEDAGASTSPPPGSPTEPHQTLNPTYAAPRQAGWRHTFSSLDNRDFRFLWLGMLFMMSGVQMELIVVGFLVYKLTSSAILLVLMEVGAAVPMLTLGLFGGAIADRFERKRVIQISQSCAVLVALFVAMTIATGAVTWVHLLVAMTLEGALFAFMMPSRQAIIPQLVGQDRLTNAMALNAAAMSATATMAPALAGSLYAFIGPDGTYFVIVGMYVASILFTAFLPRVGTGATRSEATMLRDITSGLSYVRRKHLILVLLVMGVATTLLGYPFRVLIPIFVVDVYHRGSESMGLMVSLMGLGSLAGALFVASLGKGRRGLILIAASFLSGIALLMVALIPVYFAVVGIMLLVGLGEAGRRTLNQSLIMEESEDRYRGRVMSVFMMNFGLIPLGVIPAGVSAEFLGAPVTVGILAALLLIAAFVILVTQRRLREMP